MGIGAILSSGFLFVIFIIILVVIAGIGITFSIIKNKFRHRASQHVRSQMGIGTSDINKSVNEAQGRRAYKRFLAEFPSYTEEQVESIAREMADSLLAQNPLDTFSERVIKKMNKNRLIPKIQGKEFVRATPLFYRSGSLAINVIYADQRDEYQFSLFTRVSEDGFRLERFDVGRGAVKGF